MNLKKHTAFFISLICLSSCTMQLHVSISKDNNHSKNDIVVTIKNTKTETYQGWWIYGEGQHIFKDEKTLGEYRLEFPKENMHDLALNYAYSKNYIDGVLLGVDNLNHLKLNINCIESSKTKSIINKVDEILTTNKSLLNPANWKS